MHAIPPHCQYEQDINPVGKSTIKEPIQEITLEAAATAIPIANQVL
tara:strand:- start:234 stop:371 length:138 start_codon:yes stop_codon:yes gene_type:complete